MLKLKASVDVNDGVYNACISVDCISPEAQRMLRATGDLEVDAGGVFTGTAVRAGDINTEVLFVYSGDAPAIPATATVAVNGAGTITQVTLTNPGLGYTGAVGIEFTGAGTGASGLLTVEAGSVTAIALTAGGAGYQVVPMPVSFTLAARPALVPSNLPLFYEVSSADFPDADMRASVWIDVMFARIEAEYDAHLEIANRFIATRTVEIK